MAFDNAAWQPISRHIVRGSSGLRFIMVRRGSGKAAFFWRDEKSLEHEEEEHWYGQKKRIWINDYNDPY